MMIWYNTYRYSNKATLLSAASSLVTYIAVIGAIAMVGSLFVEESALHPALAVVIGIACLALAAASYFGFYRRIPDRVAKNDLDKKLHKNVRFSYQFCKENPEMYEAVREMNPAFAEQYMRNEEGKLVKTGR